MFKYLINNEIIGVSNVKVVFDNPNVVEVEILGNEFNSIISKKEKLNKEKQEIQEWFDSFYAQHEQKYRRLIAMGKSCDDGTNANDKLTQLYEEAELKRKKFQDLELAIKN